MNGWSIYYAVWLFAGFLGPELYWVATNPRNTLSDQTWALEDLNRANPFAVSQWTDVHWLVAVVVWLLFAWLSVHIPFGLLR